MALLLLLVFGGVLTWLKMYTNHGQKLEVHNYIGKSYKKAAKHAKKESFQLIIRDSIHKVGIPGGQIIAQNPTGGSFVKKNRKLYVDVTKYLADEIPLERLPEMYGSSYKSVAEMLKNLDIESNITGYRHDPSSPDHILEVRYNGQLLVGASGKKSKATIKKGGTLDFILSKRDGAEIDLQDFTCRQYKSLGFMLEVLDLKLGAIERVGAITNQNEAWIIAQYPSYSEGKKIIQGESIEVTIQQEQPESCK